MKNLLTLIFSISVLTASAQYTASINKAKSNNLCIERGHSLTFTKTIPAKAPYTIDTKDSTVTVYPVPTTTGKCARCGADVESSEKELRVTTWRRVEQPIQPTNLSSPVTENINWGLNNQRAIDKGFHFSNLNDIKKVATLKNDTLFIHKRIEPFTALKEQSKTTTTIYYNNKPIVFKTAVYDDAAVYAGKKGLEIY